MKRSKLYILLSIITIIFLFAVAATCNRCKAEDAAEEIDVEEEEAEEAAEEEAAEEAGAKEEAGGEEEEEEEGKEAPAVELEEYEGPTLEGSVCYWRIKAVVTGDPAPDIDWNRDDSLGSFGDNIAQVNLNDPSDNYTYCNRNQFGR